MESSIDDVVSILKAGRRAKRGCSLLIGAGCSISANIPSAAGFVDTIEDRFRPQYERVEEPKTYPRCMAQLPPGTQRDLISEHVDQAKINWTHVAIAQLMKHGWVDRILTTNFDPLVVRACALIGLHPAVYDFAASQLLKPEQVPDQAVFHLHGQRTGFVLMNTEEDCREHSDRLGPLFKDAGLGRTWIIVGYSGDNDPVFDHLAEVESFEYGLYWIGYKDAAPAKHVQEKLLAGNKNAWFLPGHDADSFFVELAQKLDCFPPEFVGDPFSHLESLIEDLTEFEIARGDGTIDVMAAPRWLLAQAKALYAQSKEGDTSKLELAATPLFMTGHHEQTIALLSTVPDLSEAGKNILVWSYIGSGNTLADQARTRSGEEANRLFVAAGEKYQQALDIKPDLNDALNNWGLALAAQARAKSGEEADRLFVAAAEKYQRALDIKPDLHEALNNWGLALAAQARAKSGEEANRLFVAAAEKYQQALDIKPGLSEALDNWGFALAAQAPTKSGEEADRLFAAAAEKYQRALDIEPDLHEALYNWGASLTAQAQSKSGEEAERLFVAAAEKYQRALDIKPDLHEAFSGWGAMSLHQASRKSGAQQTELLNRAVDILMQGEAVGSEIGSYNLACAHVRLGDHESAERYLRAAREHGKLPDRAYIESDPDFDAVRDQAWFVNLLAELEASDDESRSGSA